MSESVKIIKRIQELQERCAVHQDVNMFAREAASIIPWAVALFEYGELVSKGMAVKVTHYKELSEVAQVDFDNALNAAIKQKREEIERLAAEHMLDATEVKAEMNRLNMESAL